MPSRLSAILLGVAVGPALAFSATVAAPSASDATSAIAMTRWTSTAQFDAGRRSHVTTSQGVLQLAPASTTGRWRSPWVRPGFGIATVVPSWNMTTPPGTWARIEVRARRGPQVGSWHTIADWASGTDTIHRASTAGGKDAISSVDVDTLRSEGGTFGGWQVRVTLTRPAGSAATPRVTSVSGVAAAYATKIATATSITTMSAATVLNVPTYSQEIHRGEFSSYGGGGEAWCSPTTAIMLLRYWNLGPTPADYAFASRYDDPWVDHAAINSYDYEYEGTGNWSFTMAYAGQYADAYVARFRNLRRVERLIRAGVPVGAAIAYSPGQLSGAPLKSTPGHLVAIVGFTATGDVVVNDPSASSDSGVRRTYDRGQFERAWLGGSGGVAYVVRPG